MRYIRYLTKHDPANAQIAIQRAQQVHCKRDAALHLFAAKYQEYAGLPFSLIFTSHLSLSLATAMGL